MSFEHCGSLMNVLPSNMLKKFVWKMAAKAGGMSQELITTIVNN